MFFSTNQSFDSIGLNIFISKTNTWMDLDGRPPLKHLDEAWKLARERPAARDPRDFFQPEGFYCPGEGVAK